MSVNIEIPDNALKTARSVFASTAKDVLNRLNEVLIEWNSLQPILQKLEIYVGKPVFPANYDSYNNDSAEDEVDFFLSIYDANWTWVKKAKYLIRKYKKPMTTKEMVNLIVTIYEPTLTIEKAQNSIPASLSTAFKEGKISRNFLEGGEFEYF